MGARDYNRLFAEAGDLADVRAKQLGRRRLPTDERATADEIYLKWIADEKFDALISALEGMFNAIGILSYRLEFLVDLKLELVDRRDVERLMSLFERTVPGVWRCYLREKRDADKGMLGNIAEAATRKAEILTMLYEYFESMHELGNLRLAERIKKEALRLANDGKFDPKMKSWHVSSEST